MIGVFQETETSELYVFPESETHENKALRIFTRILDP